MTNYQSTNDGLFYVVHDKQGREKLMPLSSPFKIVASTCNSEGGDWGRLVEFQDRKGQVHRINIPMDALAADGHEVRKALLQQGLIISGNKAARELLLNYFQYFKPDQHLLSVNRTGWHDNTYVMTDRSFDIAGNDQAIYQNTHGLESPYSQSGTRNDWINHVSCFAKGNSRLILAISMAFAGPLLKIANVESGGVHLYGSSSCGKTTASKVACSIWGKHSKFLHQWLNTVNGLEGIASVHSDGLLALDELGQAEPRAFANSVYTLANGQGKTRANSLGTARPPQQWRVMILSTGEITTEAHINQSGQRIKAGQVNRLVNVEADAGSGMGAFENIHGIPNPNEFSKMLSNTSETNYGTVGAEWLEYLSKNFFTCTQLVSDYIRQFTQQYVPLDAQGQVLRVATRFALIAAAGEMATATGLTGWQEGEAMAGVAKCFDNWLSNFGGAGNQEERAILSHIRSFMEANGSSRFAAWHNEDERTSNRVGFIKTDLDHGKLFLVYPEQFKSVICKGFEPKQVEKLLLQHGWLLPNERNGGARKHCIPSRKATVRMYTLVSKKLTDERVVFEPEWLPND
jgi:putative DNA primase/helicase